MMSQNLFIYIVPDKMSGHWRAALLEAASKSKWSVLEVQNEIARSEILDTNKRIWISENPENFKNADSHQCYYTNQPASSVLDLLQLYSPDENESHVAGRASAYIAQRDIFRRRGARPLQVGVDQVLNPNLPNIYLIAGEYSNAASYWNHFDNHSYETVSLPTCVMRLGEMHNDTTNGNIFALLGPNRQILAGPYFYLPIGEWRVNLKFTISNITSPIAFISKWPTPNGSSFEFKIDNEGIYEVVMISEVKDTHPCALSLSTTHSVLYGVVEILSVTIQKLQ